MSQPQPLKPVIVVTVHRRYYELGRALRNIRDLAGEFACPPDVVVVWACPEVSRLWYFQELQQEGLITQVLTRLPLPEDGEGKSTTYPESVNIRLALDWIKANYDAQSVYALVQSADVLAKKDMGYRMVDERMQGGARAVVFFWQNALVRGDIWHTNFFGVCLDEAYWPPVSSPTSDDVLEWQWGKKLMAGRLPHIVKDHNSGQRRFSHEHLSESQPDWSHRPQEGCGSTPLLIRGHQSWWRRLAEWLRLVRPFRRDEDELV